jgi:hypothetical protein
VKVPVLIVVILCVGQGISGAAPGAADPILRVEINQGGFNGTNADAIAYLAATYHVPLLAEVVFEPGRRTLVPAGSLSLEEMIDTITRQSNERWEEVGKALHIYSPEVIASKANAFGYILNKFQVGLLPSQFVFTVKIRVNSAAEQSERPTAAFGVAVSGVLPVELDSGGFRCIAATFAGKSAREIVLEEIVPAHLASIAIFPRTLGAEKWRWSSVEVNWFWFSVDRPYQALATQEAALSR